MMTDGQFSTEKKSKSKEENSLRGTLVSVGFVGTVIVMMWIGVFWLFMSRV